MEDSRSLLAARRPMPPLVLLTGAICIGIVADRFVSCSVAIWFALNGLALACWLFLLFYGRHKSAAIALLLGATALFGLWHHVRWSIFNRNNIGFAGQMETPVCLRARVLDSPQLVPVTRANPLRTIPETDFTRLRVAVKSVRNGVCWEAASGLASFTVSGHLLGIRAGDTVEILAKLRRPPIAKNPGQRDIRDYLRGNRVLAQLRSPSPDCVKRLLGKQDPLPWTWLQRLRSQLDRNLWRYVGQERSGLAAAILLGARDKLPSETTEAFFHTGTIHLLAISGLHVGMLASWLFLAIRSRFVPERAALFVVMGLIMAYAVLTEARAPVMRAAILIQFFCLGWALRRPNSSFNALAGAATVVLTLQPTSLFRVGAQLSFVAVATLCYLGGYIASAQKRRVNALQSHIDSTCPRHVRVARNALARTKTIALASAAVWCCTLPLVAYHFHLFSPLAVLLNVVLLVPISVALFCGFSVLVFAWLFPPLASLAGYVCNVNLGLIESTVQAVQHWPGAYYWTAGPPLWWVLCFYTGIVAVVIFPGIVPPRRWSCALLSLGVALPLGTSMVNLEREDAVTAVFLAVGHGVSIVVTTPDGKTVIYDAGRLGSPSPGVDIIGSYLWSRSTQTIDAIVVSHADADHFNAIPGILERFSVKTVFVSPVMFRESSPALDALQKALKESGVTIREIVEGDRLMLGPATHADVLHPPQEGVSGSDNANSITLSLQHGTQTLLLTGDLESEGLELLLRTTSIDCAVAMAPHHGSINSQPKRFARWCQPSWIIVSAGQKNSANPIPKEYQQLDCSVLHTARDGAVEIKMTATEIRVSAWLKPSTSQSSCRKKQFAQPE